MQGWGQGFRVGILSMAQEGTDESVTVGGVRGAGMKVCCLGGLQSTLN